MRNFDPTFAAELAKEILTIFLLLEMQLSTTIRYTDADIAVHFNGHRYEPNAFKIGEIASSSAMSVDRVRIEIGNADLQMSAYLMGEDARNKIVTLSFGCLLTNRTVLAEEIFRGRIGEWDLSEKTAVVQIVNEMILWKKKPLRTASSTCPWVFKDAETCRYEGSETSCDQSYDRCSELANTDNYGGFRFIPDISEKKVWWGRIPS